MVRTNEIKAQMKRVGLTQEKLAEEIGVNPSTLNRKINNETGEKLTVYEVNRIIIALNLPKTELANIFFANELTETQVL